jgi:hypothetical protein
LPADGRGGGGGVVEVGVVDVVVAGGGVVDVDSVREDVVVKGSAAGTSTPGVVVAQPVTASSTAKITGR